MGDEEGSGGGVLRMQIACGLTHTLMTPNNGQIYVCGGGMYGQLGNDKEKPYEASSAGT
jgi:alpha-tubulin suppressor-like RCC1 family protein